MIALCVIALVTHAGVFLFTVCLSHAKSGLSGITFVDI